MKSRIEAVPFFTVTGLKCYMGNKLEVPDREQTCSGSADAGYKCVKQFFMGTFFNGSKALRSIDDNWSIVLVHGPWSIGLNVILRFSSASCRRS